MRIIILCIVLVACNGGKKAEIVERIKTAKNDRTEAEINQGWFKSAATRLQAYHNMLEASSKYKSEQMAKDAQAYKQSYEMAIQQLKGVSPDILKDQNKLDSMAFIYEMKSSDLKRRIDSLELELKKY